MSTELKKIILHGDEARKALLRGIDAVADVVEPTLGPGGMNVIAEQTFYKPMVTNDGIRVAKLALNDENLNEVERLGAHIMVDTVSEEDKEAGDGTTTTTCLTRALAHKVLDKKYKGMTPMQLKHKIESEKDEVVAMIKEASSMDFSLFDVARVSIEDDSHAKVVSDIYTRYGKNVDVNLKFNKEGNDIVLEEETGYSFTAGYASPYFANNKSKMESVLTSARIFKFDTIIDHENEDQNFFDILKQLFDTYVSTPVVIIANDFSEGIINGTLALRNQMNFDITLVKRIQYKSAEISEEIDIVTGCKPAHANKDFDISVGSELVDSIIIRKDKVIIVNEQSKERVTEFVKTIDGNQERINRLTHSIITLRVGGKTYSEMNYLRHKYEDALNAVAGAMEEGVVRGAGLCLYKIDSELPDDYILKGTLKRPAEVIFMNLGSDIETAYIPDSIIDSAKTTRSAVEHACTTAGLLVTTNTVVATKAGQIEDADPSAYDTSELPVG